MNPRHLLAALFLALAVPRAAPAQDVVIVLRADTSATRKGFSGFASAPISSTTVLHSYMDATRDGATLGFALAIRGTPGWYNSRTRFSDLSLDSLAAGEVGQRWVVGTRTYRLAYNPQRNTLTAFDTTISLGQSRIVLVSLPSDPALRPEVILSSPVTVTMSDPVSFAPLFLPRAPDVRAFAGLP